MNRYLERWTEEEQEYLADNFSSCADFPMLAQHLGRTTKAVSHKAYAMGLAIRDSRAPWSTKELELLEKWAETKPLSQMVISWNKKARSVGWPHRTRGSIEKRLFLLGLSAEASVGYYKISSLIKASGFSYQVFQRWVKTGKLRAKKLNPEKETSDYLIKESDLVEFALQYPAEISERITPDGCCWLLQVIAQHRNISALYVGSAA